MIICKTCNPDLKGNGYCAEHSTSGTAYLDSRTSAERKKDRKIRATTTMSKETPQEEAQRIKNETAYETPQQSDWEKNNKIAKVLDAIYLHGKKTPNWDKDLPQGQLTIAQGLDEIRQLLQHEREEAYKQGYAEALKPKIKMIDTETAKMLSGGEFDDILKERDDKTRKATLEAIIKEIDTIYRTEKGIHHWLDVRDKLKKKFSIKL